jgi:hypothetical protein
MVDSCKKRKRRSSSMRNGLMSSTNILSSQVRLLSLTLIEKPGKGIYLMKEKAKLLKVGKKRKSHQVKTLMNEFKGAEEEMKIDEGAL